MTAGAAAVAEMLDETLAARKPVLVYKDPEPAQAAE